MARVTVTNPKTNDVRVIPAELEQQYVDRGFEVTARATAPESSELKGAALDDALDAAGLPKSGTADEKRARLAEHQANGTPPQA